MQPEQMGNIPVGAQVYDSNQDKVGKVLQVEPNGGYFMAEKGWLFPQDVYIPLDAVERVDDDGVYLRYSKSELKDQDWTNPPAVNNTTRTSTADQVTTSQAQTLSQQAADVQDVRVPLREEELVVGKQQQDVGHVHLHKDVVTEQASASVPVTHEEVHIEHVQTAPDAVATDDAFVERDIDIPVMGEEAVVGKRVQATEEVRLRKEAVTEQEQVSDTVRKERLHVEGDAPMQLDQDINNDERDAHQA